MCWLNEYCPVMNELNGVLENAPREQLIALGILVALLFLLLACRFARRGRSIRLQKSDSGSVHISRRALVDAIRTLCAHEGLTRLSKIRFKRRRGRLDIMLELKLDVRSTLGQRIEELQAKLTEMLHNTLGLDSIGRIDLRITRVELPRLPRPAVRHD